MVQRNAWDVCRRKRQANRTSGTLRKLIYYSEVQLILAFIGVIVHISIRTTKPESQGGLKEVYLDENRLNLGPHEQKPSPPPPPSPFPSPPHSITNLPFSVIDQQVTQLFHESYLIILVPNKFSSSICISVNTHQQQNPKLLSFSCEHTNQEKKVNAKKQYSMGTIVMVTAAQA